MHLSQWQMTTEEYAEHFHDDFHRVHQGVWGLFGDKQAERKFLYREMAGSGSVKILIQSEYPTTAAPAWGSLSTKQVEVPLAGEKMYSMSILANPVVEKAREGKKNSAKVPLVTPESISEWTTRRLLSKGIKVKTLRVGPAIRKVSAAKGFPLSVCEIKGVVTVEDAGKAMEAVTCGIGDAKSFGCGLLTLIPLADDCFSSEEDCDD